MGDLGLHPWQGRLHAIRAGHAAHMDLVGCEPASISPSRAVSSLDRLPGIKTESEQIQTDISPIPRHSFVRPCLSLRALHPR